MALFLLTTLFHIFYAKGSNTRNVLGVYLKDDKISHWVRRLSQDNQIKQRRAWLLLGQVTAERSCPCKRPACPAIGGGSEVTFKPLVPRLSVREVFLALTSPVIDYLEQLRRNKSQLEVKMSETEHEPLTCLLRPRAHSTSHMATLQLINDFHKLTGQSDIEEDEEGEKHADQIASEIEQNEQLMDDTPLAEKLRMEALREMPQNLTVKRTVKVKLSNSVSMKSKHRPISCLKLSKYQIGIFFSRLHLTMRDVFSSWELWYSSLKEIEGHFGSGVAAYFKFLRWLFFMNLFVCIISLSFVVIPNIVQRRADAQNRSSSLIELISSVPDQIHRPVEDMDYNATDKPAPAYFKLGHFLTGEKAVTHATDMFGYGSVGDAKLMSRWSELDKGHSPPPAAE
ncbi:Transmembrane channel-like protein 5 [Homalodisca vitripennis]|nr:Transmembrane channel-like protein 5 [Homalodisca vitripennis]